MNFFFPKRKIRAELVRENNRMLDESIREIERERLSLQTLEKKLIFEIKESAKQGQMGGVRVMAKDVVRIRHEVEKFYKLKSQFQGVSLRIQTLKSTQAMDEAMKGVTKAVGRMNRSMNMPSVKKIMQEFKRRNAKMELTYEVMGDAIDDAFEGDKEEEEEIDELMNRVFDEIGVDINQEDFCYENAPSSAVANSKVPQVETLWNNDGGIYSDLEAWLDNLIQM